MVGSEGVDPSTCGFKVPAPSCQLTEFYVIERGDVNLRSAFVRHVRRFQDENRLRKLAPKLAHELIQSSAIHRRQTRDDILKARLELNPHPPMARELISDRSL